MFLRATQFSLLTATAIFLASCSDKGTPDYNPEVGPFDEDGNYVEAWADNPPKKKSSSSSWKTKSKPSTSSWNEKSSSSWKTKTIATPKEEPKPVVISRTRPTPAPKPVATPTPRPRPEPTVVRKPTPKPTPKPAPVVKPKPKPKPAPVKVTPKVRRHSVAKGETLYSISRRYKVTVKEIQKANGLSGTTIRDGQTLTIPIK